jgi:lysophospholipase L1-like esterase
MSRIRPSVLIRAALYALALGLALAAAWMRFSPSLAKPVYTVVRREALDSPARKMLEREARLAPGSVVFLGDSLTYSLDVDQVVPGAFNAGIPGYTTWHLLRLLPHMQSIPRARLVVLTIGTNDVRRGLTPMIAGRLHEVSKAIPGPMLWNAIPPSIHGDVGPVNAAAREACRARADCIFVETNFEASDFYDGEHPNAAGNARWIARMRAALAR